MNPRRIAVLAVHPTSVAATRLRALQFGPYLSAAGLELRLWSFFSERDLGRWFGNSQVARILVVLRGLLRVPAAVREVLRSDVVLVQREALPLGPPLLEWFASRVRPLVWDVDDSIWVDFVSPTAGRVPRWVRATGDKYRRICRYSTEVWPGSELLATWCRQHNATVRVTPTVVPVPMVRPTVPADGSISWIGSHSTAVFLDDVLAALATAGVSRRVAVVGGRPKVPTRLDVELLAWSPQVEEEVLRGSRVGLYPVDRTHPLAEGKCGLKAVLYMAHGIPPIVTPTTTNAFVVRDGVEGFHADLTEEWPDRVARLLSDGDLWEAMSAAAHRRAREEFSLEVWGPRIAARFAELAARPRRGVAG